MSVVDKFQIRYWNGKYYAVGVLPNSNKVELKSDVDLTYAQWVQKFDDYWEQIQKPEPEECQCPDCKVTFVCPNRSP